MTGTGPAERAAYLAGVAEEVRGWEWERTAIPALSGNMYSDLAAADEAVRTLEAAWDEADGAVRALQLDAGPFPDRETTAEITRARQRSGELWQLRERAVRNRAVLEARHDPWR